MDEPDVKGAALRENDRRARALREELVEQMGRFRRPWNLPDWLPEVMATMRKVPRHRLAPSLSLAKAYCDEAQPIGHGQTISQPTMVALMTQALELAGSERVLEIGTGSGYQTAILSHICKEVFTMELLSVLGKPTASRLAALGLSNISFCIGDGYSGWPEHAPFDRILLAAAPAQIPKMLLGQLCDGGILVGPVGIHEQQLVRVHRRGDSFASETLGSVRFVPMVAATCDTEH